MTKNAAKPKSLLIDGWEVVIGIEIHTQLATQSKIFSGSSTEFGQDPNTQASLVDLAMPGVLPVLNKEVVDLAIRFGLGIDAYIDQASVFARKNYFYPDSPKGYQISQMDNPIVGLGHIDIQLEDGTVKRIGVTRAHLEEDAGKSIHDQFEGMSGIDLNRAGTPLLEIVSEPDMRSVEEAVAYIKSIHTLVRWLGISDGNMAEGSFRADCNVSLRRPGQPFGTRCELKNLNSFRFIEQAINVEIERQMEILEWDGTIDQETRLFDPVKMETRSMRSKEEANDYRYFPDPDLLPVIISDAQIETARAALPELPAARRERFVADFGVTEYDAHVLTLTREMSDFYEDLYEANIDAKEDYFEDVLDEKYPSINEAQTFLEIMDNDFTLKNQVKQRASQRGHWAWKVGDDDVETINFGDYMQEALLLKTGSGISEYKMEKMYDELAKRVKSRLPKGAKDVKIEPHYRKNGVTTVVFVYPYSKRIDGEDIQGYHEKFERYIASVSDDLHDIIEPYYQAPAKKKVYSLRIDDFMQVIDDGLESLPVHEAKFANGQWKFKYKGVAYIITNYKSYMELAFIYTLPRGMDLDKPSDYLEDEIEDNYASFADKYGVDAYRNSKRTLMLRMQINYGMKGSKNATGEKLKAKYDAFTRRIAPDLQQRLKAYIGL